MPYFLKLLYDNVMLVNLLLGTASIDELKQKYELADEYEKKSFIFQNVVLDTNLVFNEMQIVMENASVELKFKTTNDIIINELEKYFITASDTTNYLHIYSIRRKLNEHCFHFKMNDKWYKILVSKYNKYCYIDVHLLERNFSKFSDKKLQESENSEEDLFLGGHETSRIESKIISKDEYIEMLNSKYDYWNKTYFFSK
ncbi:MAG: hypothetical protein IPN29_18970 [Saprospiraceae bacterium]|nr:hypothetical protein [Saprospiraceae bacterium]